MGEMFSRKKEVNCETKTNLLAVELSGSGLHEHKSSDVDEAKATAVGQNQIQPGEQVDGGGLSDDNIGRDHIKTI